MTTYGGGCGGLELSFSGSAAIGSTLNVHATGGGANSPIALNIGGMNTMPFPVDTSSFGIPGCWILNDSLAAVATQTDASGAATIPMAIPPGFSGYGLRLFHQFVHINLSGTATVSASNGGRSVIGPACP